MDFSKALSYPQNDPGWLKKTLILIVVHLVPILNLAGLGYTLETIRRVSRGDESTLPEWDQLGDYFMDGLRVTVTSMAYGVLVSALFLVGTLLVVMVGMGLAMVAGDQGDLVGMVVFVAQVALVWIPTGLASLLFILATPAVLMQLAGNQGWGAGFDFAAVKGLVTRDLGGYLMVYLMALVFGLLASLGVILCGVGVLATSAYAQLCTAYVYAQYVRGGSSPAVYS